MEDSSTFLSFFHGILRYAVLISVTWAAWAAWSGLIRKRPILVMDRMMAIIGLITCHTQLLVGVFLYISRYKYMTKQIGYTPEAARFFKYEHASMMILAIILVTLGRVLSKRTKLEGSKQLLVGVFYTLALLIMLYAIPWPFSNVAIQRGWLY